LRLGVLGGAFNPPHIGHLVLAQEAAWQMSLERVLLIPYGEAPHREIEQDPGRDARLEMARLAAEGDERLEASAIEVERVGPSYTYETLELLAEEDPGGELVFVMGADAAAALERWKRPERVLELATLGIAGRAGVGEETVRTALERVGADDRATIFPIPEVGVSSTLARKRAAAGGPLRYLVPDAVAAYIEREGLYSG
jgi:nicotinate-nucleotide adenylyltransferase